MTGGLGSETGRLAGTEELGDAGTLATTSPSVLLASLPVWATARKAPELRPSSACVAGLVTCLSAPASARAGAPATGAVACSTVPSAGWAAPAITAATRGAFLASEVASVWAEGLADGVLAAGTATVDSMRLTTGATMGGVAPVTALAGGVEAVGADGETACPRAAMGGVAGVGAGAGAPAVSAGAGAGVATPVAACVTCSTVPPAFCATVPSTPGLAAAVVALPRSSVRHVVAAPMLRSRSFGSGCRALRRIEMV